MERWLIICHGEEFDFKSALNRNTCITWPQSAGIRPGDVVCFYDPDSEMLLFRAVAEQTDLLTMDPESTEFVRSISFYDEAGRYMRLRLADKSSKIIKGDVLLNYGIDPMLSGRLTPAQAAVFGNDPQGAGRGQTAGAHSEPPRGKGYPFPPGMEQGGTVQKGPPHKKSDRKWIILICAAASLLIAFIVVFFGYHVYDPPTCEEPSVCKICRKQIAPATGHDWDEGVVLQEATCETDGAIKYTCKNDPSHVEERKIPAKGHDWAEATYDKPSTCRNCGETMGDRKGMRYDVTFSSSQAEKLYVTKEMYVTPLMFSEKVKDCRELKLGIQVDSSASIFGKKWDIYLRCDGSWVHQGQIKLKSGVRKNKVIKLNTPATVDGVYVVPGKRPNKSYSWNTTFWVDYVQVIE